MIEHHHLQSIIESYGVRSEAALITGKLVQVRNRISSKETEDGSVWNTERMIAILVENVTKRYREAFFAPDREATFIPLDDAGPFAQDVGRRMVPDEAQIPLELAVKAGIWYRVAYDARVNTTGLRSFAWIMSDLLVVLKMKRMVSRRTNAIHS